MEGEEPDGHQEDQEPVGSWIATLSEQDYEQFVPQVEQSIKTFGKIRMVFTMKDFHGGKPFMTTSLLGEQGKQQSSIRCKSRVAPNNRGGGASSDEDELMEKILANLQSTPQGEVLKRVGSLPEIRRGKVLNICRQITQGTYEVEGRLERVIDRVLEAH